MVQAIKQSKAEEAKQAKIIKKQNELRKQEFLRDAELANR